jgi:hypothetical protein
MMTFVVKLELTNGDIKKEICLANCPEAAVNAAYLGNMFRNSKNLIKTTKDVQLISFF